MEKFFLVRRPWRIPESEWPSAVSDCAADHLVWMRQQHITGRILLSGPDVPQTCGMYLMRANSREEAVAVAKSDPFTLRGYSDFELTEWEIHQALGIGPFTVDAVRAQFDIPTELSERELPD